MVHYIPLRTKKIPVVYEDQALLLVDKPAGLLSVGGEGSSGRDLTSLLQEYFRLRNARGELIACHRLDRETSGIMVLTKDRRSAQAIMDAFRNRQVKKTYVAFVQGDFALPRGSWEHRLHGAWPYSEQQPKTALSHFQTVLRHRRFSVLKLQPVTGRTNQLRLQLQAVGYPLVGDRRFSLARQWAVPFPRAALHSWRIAFRHPVSGAPLQCSAPLPDDMREFLTAQGINYERFLAKL
ncbi:MAG: RluA family pseudouridine synthase [Candidatus Omnitrophica bacterium]|nr:RluA family pseudouridine synthase [Candidatus Omnitrophota bacterium]